MKPQIRFDYEEFKKVIGNLEQNNLTYFIFGGFAIDALLNEKSKHDDLDLIIIKEDLMKLTKILKKMGYASKKLGRLAKFTKKTEKQKYQIGVLFIKELKNFYKIKGNRSEEIISKEAFTKPNYLKLKSTKFRVMPFEWFSLYQKIDHYNQNKRERHKKAMEVVIPFCKKIKILSHKPIKRIKSDPKFIKK